MKGSGTRFIGSNISRFFDGDMVLVGANVPHFWQNDEKYFQQDLDVKAEVILLQFEQNVLNQLLALPEMMEVNRLLERAKQGIQFEGRTILQAAELLWLMVNKNESNKVLLLLQLLDLLAKSNHYKTLSNLDTIAKVPLQSTERIQTVCTYILEHYRRALPLSEVARVANMSEKAFCRFFKKSTQKTLTQFVNELRISYACKLLLTQQHTITKVCFESGFNNLSNFNRVFKNIMGKTPTAYRRNLPAIQ